MVFFERFKRPFLGLSSTTARTRSLAKQFLVSFLKAVIPKCLGGWEASYPLGLATTMH